MADRAHPLEKTWTKRGAISNLLLPLAWVFGALAASRRFAFRHRIASARRVAVPVIVVGNITVGGAGKTPLVLALSKLLTDAGWHPAIVSRGYGGSHATGGRASLVEYPDATRFGDEAVLYLTRGTSPIAVAARRADAAELILKHHPEVDIILSDDGLQHYGLARDIEVAVFDGRGIGNGRLLPAGPLREPLSRVSNADAIVINGSLADEGARVPNITAGRAPSAPRFAMQLVAEGVYPLNALHPLPAGQTRAELLPLEGFRERTVLAAAGIGNPERFFTMLEGHGLTIERMALADHFPFRENPFVGEGAEIILITEKDAVKCVGWNDPRIWVVPVATHIDAAFGTLILEKLRAHQRTGSSPA